MYFIKTYELTLIDSKYNISEVTNQANNFGVKTESNYNKALNFYKME